MGKRTVRCEPHGVTRRNFLKASAVLAAAGVSGGSLVGCGETSLVDTNGRAIDTEKGEWRTAACWHNCGGRCLNKVFVQDGVVIRQKTDDTHEDSADCPQQRGCLRGRAQRKQVFSEDRLRYPMKRKNWSPDDPHGDLRGIDEWERISWDEALDYVAAGLKRAKEQYGNRSIMLMDGWSSEIHEMSRTLGLYGGYCEYWDTNSFGSWCKTPFVVGFDHDGVWDQTVNDRYDLRECETIIMMSMNPAWSATGSQMWGYWQAKLAGAEFICIDPAYTDTCSALGAEWLPVRPATDTALLLGVAHAMLELDGEYDLIDWDFLDRCTVGFDADHMPVDARENINFKDYVLGAYDNEPKTPEWASEICGVEATRIRQLALKMGKHNKVAFLCGMASARANNVDNLPQLVMTIGAMGGHMGKSGHMTGSTMHATSGNGGPALIMAGSDGLPAIANPVDDSINANEAWDAVLEGSYTWTGPGSMVGKNQFGPGEKRDIDIHVLYHCGGAGLQTTNGMARGIEAHRKVDMVVTHAQFYTTNARYSDIVLPVTTEWEKFGGFSGGSLVHSSNREMMIAYEQVVEPLFECKSDQEIAMLIGERLGIDGSKIYPFDAKQQYFNALSSMTTIDEDGKTKVNAVAITADDIEEMGVKGDPQEGKLAYEELKKRGVYQVMRHQGDNYGYIAFKDFRENPFGNPLKTPSGKLEIYSQTLADMINQMGYSRIKPIPTYITVTNGYEDTFSNWDSQDKGEYPLQLINQHYLRRAHTVFDNVGWLREAWTNPVFVSAKDAQAINVKDGDTVLVSSPYGKTIRNACVTQRMRPGVVGLPHGAWVDVDEKSGIDQAGADNFLTGLVPNGQGVSGFNSNICKIEKYTGEQLKADADMPARIPLKDGE
ncbi:molybdopterin-dependent oxidoreductase [Curtanaerobium respiraculi]|uniref:molybdopterin-dependent oxidoreductase n=1 Tax=Curtanaerobium respiraculi TaxID=2949669 RepID=UPI0024B3983C|nr:molybdopterin-dependent oxidoreductase [Curtanaerobium respiraculi]